MVFPLNYPCRIHQLGLTHNTHHPQWVDGPYPPATAPPPYCQNDHGKNAGFYPPPSTCPTPESRVPTTHKSWISSTHDPRIPTTYPTYDAPIWVTCATRATKAICNRGWTFSTIIMILFQLDQILPK